MIWSSWCHSKGIIGMNSNVLYIVLSYVKTHFNLSIILLFFFCILIHNRQSLFIQYTTWLAFIAVSFQLDFHLISAPHFQFSPSNSILSHAHQPFVSISLCVSSECLELYELFFYCCCYTAVGAVNGRQL